MCQVRTFAEEVYTEFVKPDPTMEGADGLARALAVAFPPALFTGLIVAALAWGWRKSIPPLGVAPPSEWPLIHLRSARWPAVGLVIVLLLAATGVPIASLVWKAGRVPPDGWSAQVLAQQFVRAWDAQSTRMLTSLLWSAITGFGIAALALFLCWAFLETRFSWKLLILSVILLWSLPGPVIGIGLKDAINSMMNAEDAVFRQRTAIASTLLYNGRTPLPVMWATGLRFVPCAVALLWPVVRLIPRELHDSIRIDSGAASAELRHVILPLTAGALARATLIGAALCLGELSASKLVETPAGQTFAHEIFTQMHTGVSNHLAAMCLILLAFVAAIGVLLAVFPARSRPS
jgi:ABC-type Fe3+ transport system permease subunit